jgi:regulator of protease activity HflC (stomatin/prohibitin superfamily)
MAYLFPLALVFFILVLLLMALKIVPQQNAYIVERLGRFSATLQPGFTVIVPFIDRIAYKHSLKERALDIPEQICITRDNVQVSVDGVLFFQVIDPQRASYGIADYTFAVIQLAQTTMRSEIGKIDLDKTFEERSTVNMEIVQAIDEAAIAWGVKVLRYEIKNITPPQSVLLAMEKQMQAEREKRAKILQSEGERQSQVNLAEGQKQKVVLESEGKQLEQINSARGEAEAILSVAKATAEGLRLVADAIQQNGGFEAMQLRVAENLVEQFGKLARTNNTMILPANFADLGGIVAASMSIIKNQEGFTAATGKTPGRPTLPAPQNPAPSNG